MKTYNLMAQDTGYNRPSRRIETVVASLEDGKAKAESVCGDRECATIFEIHPHPTEARCFVSMAKWTKCFNGPCAGYEMDYR